MAMAQHLLVVADRYINKDTVANKVVLAEQHGCHGLKQACLRFMVPCNMKVVLASEGFEYLSRSCPSLLKELAANRV